MNSMRNQITIEEQCGINITIDKLQNQCRYPSTNEYTKCAMEVEGRMGQSVYDVLALKAQAPDSSHHNPH